METDTINKLFLELSQVATAKTARQILLEDLLTSARAIAERKGEGTAWERFSNRLAEAGVGSITPKTFRVLPDDEPDETGTGPKAPSVTLEQISALISRSEISTQTIFDKVTLVSVRLPSGFVLTASSGAVSADNYDERIGAEICMDEIKDQLWKLEGYHLQKLIEAELLAASL